MDHQDPPSPPPPPAPDPAGPEAMEASPVSPRTSPPAPAQARPVPEQPRPARVPVVHYWDDGQEQVTDYQRLGARPRQRRGAEQQPAPRPVPSGAQQRMFDRARRLAGRALKRADSEKRRRSSTSGDRETSRALRRKQTRWVPLDSDDFTMSDSDEHVNTLTCQIKEGSLIPQKGTALSAAYDVRSAKNVLIPPGQTVKVPLKFNIHLPAGFCLLLVSRSGLASRGITTTPGVIDEDYRGEVASMIHNSTEEAFQVERGQRISQALILKVHNVNWEVVPELQPAAETHRGFGSTGL